MTLNKKDDGSKLIELLTPFINNQDAEMFPVVVKTDSLGVAVIGEANNATEAVYVGASLGISSDQVSHARHDIGTDFWLLHGWGNT